MNLQQKDPLNIVITGVGGQGNLVMSRLLGETLISDGYLVTIGETIGMSQRNGSVASLMRISRDTQYMPLIPEGTGDIIVGLEPMETMRALASYGNPETFVITNIRPVPPMAIVTSKIDYPTRTGWKIDGSRKKIEYPTLETIKQYINSLSQNTWYIDASQIALDLDMPRLTNVVMVGALVSSGLTPLKEDKVRRQIEINFGKKFLELNIKAFEAGLVIKIKQC
ncbi:indolepyruvate oxidoreductase subunit beta [Chloroflexota bacterium]